MVEGPVLHRLLVYNPSINMKEDGAADNLLFHWPGSPAVTIDEQLMEFGLAATLCGIMASFSDDPVQFVETDNLQYCFAAGEAGSGLTFVLIVAKGENKHKYRRAAQAVMTSPTRGGSEDLHSTRHAAAELILNGTLAQAMRLLQFHEGSMVSLQSDCGWAAVRAALGRVLTPWASVCSLHRRDVLDALNGVQFIPAGAGPFLAVHALLTAIMDVIVADPECPSPPSSPRSSPSRASAAGAASNRSKCPIVGAMVVSDGSMLCSTFSRASTAVLLPFVGGRTSRPDGAAARGTPNAVPNLTYLSYVSPPTLGATKGKGAVGSFVTSPRDLPTSTVKGIVLPIDPTGTATVLDSAREDGNDTATFPPTAMGYCGGAKLSSRPASPRPATQSPRTLSSPRFGGAAPQRAHLRLPLSSMFSPTVVAAGLSLVPPMPQGPIVSAFLSPSTGPQVPVRCTLLVWCYNEVALVLAVSDEYDSVSLATNIAQIICCYEVEHNVLGKVSSLSSAGPGGPQQLSNASDMSWNCLYFNAANSAIFSSLRGGHQAVRRSVSGAAPSVEELRGSRSDSAHLMAVLASALDADPELREIVLRVRGDTWAMCRRSGVRSMHLVASHRTSLGEVADDFSRVVEWFGGILLEV